MSDTYHIITHTKSASSNIKTFNCKSSFLQHNMTRHGLSANHEALCIFEVESLIKKFFKRSIITVHS